LAAAAAADGRGAGIRRSRTGGQPRPRQQPAWGYGGRCGHPRHARGAAALAQVSSGAPARVRPSSVPDLAAAAMCSSFLHLLRHRSKGIPGRRERRARRRPGGGGRRVLAGGGGGRALRCSGGVGRAPACGQGRRTRWRRAGGRGGGGCADRTDPRGTDRIGRVHLPPERRRSLPPAAGKDDGISPVRVCLDETQKLFCVGIFLI